MRIFEKVNIQRLVLSFVCFAGVLAGLPMAASAQDVFNSRVCNAGLSLGHASGRVAFADIFGDPNQVALARTNLSNAAQEIAAAESLLPSVYDNAIRRQGTSSLRQAILKYEPGRASGENAAQYIRNLAMRYRQTLSVTYDSSRPDSLRYQPSCASNMMLACFSYGRATVAAAAGDQNAVTFDIGQMRQAIRAGLSIAFDGPHVEPSPRKQCCAFGPAESWAIIEAMDRWSTHAVFTQNEGLLRATAQQAFLPGGCSGEKRASSCLSGSWTYRTSNGFTDTHTFLDDGRMKPAGFWTISGNTVTVEWPNGWRNIYELDAECQQMTGISLGPKGQQRETTMRRQGAGTAALANDGAGSQGRTTGPWFIGVWTYRTASGFTDTHTFLAGGRMQPSGTWSKAGSQLIIDWPNGWRNLYQISGPANRLTGVSIAPDGHRVESTLVKR